MEFARNLTSGRGAEEQGAEDHAFDHAKPDGFATATTGATTGNAVKIAGSAFALDAESFQKFFEKLLAGGLANGVGPGYIQFLGQEKLFEKPAGGSVNMSLGEKSTGGVGYGMGSRHGKITP